MMACDENRERIVLLIYGELEEPHRIQLEGHLAACAVCSAVLEDERRTADLVAGEGDRPTDSLLRRCRDDLRSSLERDSAPAPAAAPARPFKVRWSPAWAAALVVAGFVAGRVLPLAGPSRTSDGSDAALEEASTIANVDFHDSDPLSERVSLSYDTLRRTSLVGTASDPRIRRVLVDTVRDSRNAGLRLLALDVLRRHLDDREVRAAVLRTVREDDNAGARLKALEALKDRAPDDPEVRDVIVEALLKDTNPGVRVRAIDALSGVRGPETLAVLRRLAGGDPNEYVRLRSAALAGEMLSQESVR